MKQVVLSPRTGALEVADVPAPGVRPGTILVHNAASVVSSGTERSVIDLAGRSLLGKARARPDLVRDVMNKIRRDGFRTTVSESFLRLERPHLLGYSSAGTILEVAEGVGGFHPGDRVACAGAGSAVHAEVVAVPHGLCVPLAADVSWESGAFTMLGAIALHGVRRAAVGLGDVVAVLGLGVVGQLTAQLLRSAGCRVVAFDLIPRRSALAEELGADAAASSPDALRGAASSLSGGAGVDAVLITAATESNAPLELAAEITRSRATVVMVGVTGMRVPRRAFWEKELALLLSRASGPGSGDEHEPPGTVYPQGYVRWSASRNMALFAAELARGSVRVEPLITHRFPIERAGQAYGLIRGAADGSHLGIVLTYPDRAPAGRSMVLRQAVSSVRGGEVRLGVIGAGLFAQTVLLPVLRRVPRVRLRSIATASGVSARSAGGRLAFEICTTDYRAVLDDPEVDGVVIATRHDLHAPLAAEALRAGKHVFIEKPLGLTSEDIRVVVAAYQESPRVLAVGFNRRFSPLVREVKRFFGGERPLALLYRINAGSIPPDHWVYDPIEGGGRWLSEGGHFIDLLQYVTDADPVSVFTRTISTEGTAGESLVISVGLHDSSAATIVYADGADRAESRERLEIFGRGRAATIEDFRRATLTSGGRPRRIRYGEASRGYYEELEAWVAAVLGKAPPAVPLPMYVANAACCFAVLESARSGAPVRVDVTAMMPRAPDRGRETRDGG
jgi:predicted dehydrogenase